MTGQRVLGAAFVARPVPWRAGARVCASLYFVQGCNENYSHIYVLGHCERRLEPIKDMYIPTNRMVVYACGGQLTKLYFVERKKA